MNIELYKSSKQKMDSYGYILQEIIMEYSYGDTFLTYKYIDLEDVKCVIHIPTVNEVVIKNKNIVKTAIELMKLFSDDKTTILSQLPNLIVATNEKKFRKLSNNKEYNRIIDEKISTHYEQLTSDRLD
ncbi:MAG: hypothetical protein IKC49_00395 [Clostridia bacterium]|nr:hypothetical protein [Clostridia bacterium]